MDYPIEVPHIKDWTRFDRSRHAGVSGLYVATCSSTPLYIGKSIDVGRRLAPGSHLKIELIRKVFPGTRLFVCPVIPPAEWPSSLKRDFLKAVEETQINIYLPPGNKNITLHAANSFDAWHSYWLLDQEDLSR